MVVVVVVVGGGGDNGVGVGDVVDVGVVGIAVGVVNYVAVTGVVVVLCMRMYEVAGGISMLMVVDGVIIT